MSLYLCIRKLHKIVIKMEQKKINIKQVKPTRMHLELQLPNKERTLCVEPGTFIGTDTHIFVCTESPIQPHCVDCDAPRELCKIMCCMPKDRLDRKYVQFRCVSSNDE